MEKTIPTVFTKEAEAQLFGETGIHKITWFTYPNVGDLITLRTSPSNKVLHFVCKSRHFDFTDLEEPVLTITLDVPFNNP
jgi:hypothetical protein